MALTAPEDDVQTMTVDESESGASKETDGTLEDGEIVDVTEISEITDVPEAKSEVVDVPVSTQVLTRSTGIEYTFGTFFNWFMPSCMDIWDASDDGPTTSGSSLEASQTILAYGARSYLFLLDVHQTPVEATTKGRMIIDQSSSWSFVYHDLVNVFNHTISKKYTDVFRSTASYITTVVFEKRAAFLGKSGSNCDAQGPRVFVGNSDGAVALYNLKTRTSVLQDLPFGAFKRPCCRKVAQPKILAAAWMVTKALGSVVFYSLDTHLIRWEVESGQVTVQHDGQRDCSGGGARLLGQVAISCLASMSAEATADRREHKLAVGFNGGKIALFGFDPASGAQTSLRLLLDNAHSDDVCSLSFSGYAIGSIASYRCGLLTSVSRDSVLKVWSLGNEAEIAEFRINTQTGPGGGGAQARKGPQGGGGPSDGQSKCNWFAASFLPRPSLTQRDPGNSGSSGVAYEIIVTAPSGELVTITVPEKEPNAKIRIAKASKFITGNGRGSGSLAHNSVIFSVMINAKLGIAITYSLDYKMILWDLGSRSSKAVFHHFANGALSIDSCLKDKRIAIAFGNSVYTMDFGASGSMAPGSGQMRTLTSGSMTPSGSMAPGSAGITAYRCTTAPKAWKFYQVSWNNLSDSERLGALALGNSNGEVLVWDLNERSYTTRPAGKVGKGGDGSKIYRFVWPVKFPGALDQVRTVVLSLHASGAILVNYLPSRHYPTRPAENFMTGKFISGLPAEGLLRKHTALDEHDRGRFLVVGNDDGTVDLLKARDTSPSAVEPGALWDPTQPLYSHLYRFRAFTTPIISIEVSGSAGNPGNGLWVAITALHDSSCHCYRLEEEAPDVTPTSETPPTAEEVTPTAELLVVQPKQRYKLSGHSDRVAASSWSPFSGTSGAEDEDQRLLVTASYDTTCIIWNVPKQQALRRFYGHRSLIYTIRWSHFREDLIFTGGEDAFHAWNWTAQPEFDPSINGSVLGKSLVTVRSLKRSFKETNGEMAQGEVVKKKGPSSGTASAPECSITSSISAQLPALAPVQVKALFSLSNQIENNSSKAEILEDIKWIARLREYYRSSPDDSAGEPPEEVIPGSALARILLYSPSLIHLERFLAAERENHRKRKQAEAVAVIELLSDAKTAIERAIEEGQADLTLASLAVAFSRDLYKRCVESHWKSSTAHASSSAGATGGSKSATASWSRSQRMMAAYGREMEAITRLLCLSDFPGALAGLTEAGLHREAIVLAKGGLASEELLAGLWEAWYKVRAGGNAEGAVKCLVAAGKVKEAVELLRERRKLAAGLTTNKGDGDEDKVGGGVLQRYDEVITILEEMI